GPVNWVVLTPQMDRIHHSKVPAHIDRNFAFIFPLWDVLFSTYYHPRADEYPKTGLASGETIVSARQAVAWPFLRWLDLAAQAKTHPGGGRVEPGPARHIDDGVAAAQGGGTRV